MPSRTVSTVLLLAATRVLGAGLLARHGRCIDLSKPFAAGGRTYEALPGMKPGYFRGTAPDLGAIQYGETPPHTLSPLPSR